MEGEVADDGKADAFVGARYGGDTGVGHLGIGHWGLRLRRGWWESDMVMDDLLLIEVGGDSKIEDVVEGNGASFRVFVWSLYALNSGSCECTVQTFVILIILIPCAIYSVSNKDAVDDRAKPVRAARQDT